MRVVDRFAEARRASSGLVGLVPTMGFLHEGHLSLVRASAARCDTTVVSVFVNPLQFGEAADLDAYPRDLERDVALAAEAGANVVVAPSVEAMYPPGATTVVDVPGISDAMEGVHRPGHFRGVTTIVAKLFAGLQPDVAFFGRKDAQQLAVVSALARDLSFPVEVVGRPIVRERDGLALSSRNVRIAAADRPDALVLSRGLFAAADRYESGSRSGRELVDAVVSATAGSRASLEYATLADVSTAAPTLAVGGRQFLAVAARVGEVRLIDNILIDGETESVDRGATLSEPSILYGGS